MKGNSDRSMKKRPLQAKIEDAYDLDEARKSCRLLGYEWRYAFAFMSGGRVKMTNSPSSEILLVEAQLYEKWLQESSYPDLLLNRAISQKQSRSNQRLLRCLAYSLGDSWEIWNEVDVCRKLCNSRKLKSKGWAFIPIENTILDPDRKSTVWSSSSKLPAADRCMALGEELLRKTVQIYLQAEQLIPTFSMTFTSIEQEEGRSSEPRTAHIARLILESKHAALRLIDASMALAAGARSPDEAIAFRQGFLMGTWLSQAEAIITNERSAKLASAVGGGKKPSKFWIWVNTSKHFAGKSAKEVWPLLHGSKDPDQPSRKLTVEDDLLKRGNGVQMTESSFRAKFRRH